LYFYFLKKIILETFNLPSEYAFTADSAYRQTWLYFLQLNKRSFIVDLGNSSITRRDSFSPENPEPSDDDSPLEFMPNLAEIRAKMNQASLPKNPTPEVVPLPPPAVKKEPPVNPKTPFFIGRTHFCTTNLGIL